MDLTHMDLAHSLLFVATIFVFLLLTSGRQLKWRRRRRSSATTERAVFEAFKQCGLPIEQYGPEFNLNRAGKLGEVLFLAARELDPDRKFETVQDVIDALTQKEARK